MYVFSVEKGFARRIQMHRFVRLVDLDYEQ